MPEIPPGFLESLPLNYKHLRRGFGLVDVDPGTVRRGRELYYGFSEWVDAEIGKVLTALEKSPFARDTVVIYTTDHGENIGEHGLWWKNCMYEHAAHIPLLVSWPQRWAGGQRRRGACAHVDVVRTVAEIGGAEVPGDWNGTSLVRWLDDPKTPWKDRAVSQYYAHNIASTGTVTRIDLSSMTTTHTIPVELHPTALAWDEAAGRLYVANTNKDSVSVIDTAQNKVLRTIPIQPFAEPAAGIAPTALALAAGGRKLFVACGGINAVAQVDTASGRIDGLIPTAWYPNGLAVSLDGKFLAVSALLGAGSGWRDAPGKRFVHAYRGSATVLELPDAAQLAAYTTAVSENNHLPLTTVAAPSGKAVAPKAIPARSGDPSFIEHVVYVIKENRTYDQVFGDLPKGNGDPALVMFGEDITPNHHRLAEQFVLLDNFYATGGNSGDGRQWLTQANETAYCLWPGYQGRSYPFDGTDPIAYSSSGFLWDYALARGKTVRVYGEYAGRLPEPGELRVALLKEWADGADFTTRWDITAPIASLNKVLAKNYPPYSNAVPDVVRAQIFLKDLAQWEREGGMPHLVIMLLNCDHTYGTSPGLSTPAAMVADNDLALGQVVEGLTRSKFWPKMAIFVVEDDAQNGVDHVDGHRTVALAVSPYTRRGHVDSTFYSNQSMLKTIELILGLPTMSLFDLIALDMRASFTDTADPAPYAHVVPKQDVFVLNPPASALRGEARRAALASARMRWDVPDAAPSEALNRILWHAVRGWNTPYPGVRRAVFDPLALETEDDERDYTRRRK